MTGSEFGIASVWQGISMKDRRFSSNYLCFFLSGAWARSEAAIFFTSAGVLGFLSFFPEMLAGFFPVSFGFLTIGFLRGECRAEPTTKNGVQKGI